MLDGFLYAIAIGPELVMPSQWLPMVWGEEDAGVMPPVESKEAAVVQAKAVELLTDWKALLHTVTTDNGKEFAYHKKVSEELEVECYFAKPYHSWERGANENLNGLVRQYFPKGMNFGRITEQRVNEVVDILNQRPRKRFGFRSPEEVFQNATLNNEGVAFIT